MTKTDRVLALERAAAELRSAYTLVADPHCDLATALPHLRWAWEAIAWLSRGEVPAEPGADLTTWLAPEHLEQIPARAREALHRSLKLTFELGDAPRPWTKSAPESAPESVKTPSLPRARALVTELRSLNELVDTLERQERGHSLTTQTRLRWALRGAVALVAVTSVGLLALRPWQSESAGAWRVGYFSGKNLEGDPELHRAFDAAFDFGKEAPTESIPSDYFSARFDSCLVLDEDTRAAFMLVSDDGSRLFVDGELLVDNWKKKKSRVSGEFSSLGAGVHHLRVEYFEHFTNASLSLTASFDEDEPPAPIPASMLTFPGMDFDEADPCAGAR